MSEKRYAGKAVTDNEGSNKEHTVTCAEMMQVAAEDCSSGIVPIDNLSKESNAVLDEILQQPKTRKIVFNNLYHHFLGIQNKERTDENKDKLKAAKQNLKTLRKKPWKGWKKRKNEKKEIMELTEALKGPEDNVVTFQKDHFFLVIAMASIFIYGLFLHPIVHSLMFPYI